MSHLLEKIFGFHKKSGTAISKRTSRRQQAVRGLMAEALEQRTLLSVTPSLDGNKITFEGERRSDDQVYLRTENDVLQWSGNGLDFSSDFNISQPGIQAVTIQGSTSQSIVVNAERTSVTLGNLETRGASLSIDTDEAIHVVAGATVSTVLNPSAAGGLSLTSIEKITVNSGATLTTGRSDLVLNSSYAPSTESSQWSIETGVDLIEATIIGGNVQITSAATAQAKFGVDGILQTISVNTDSFLGGLSLGGGVSISNATAGVSIQGGSITADSLSVLADADTDSRTRVITAFVGVAYVESNPSATVNIDGGAEITTTGNVQISADAALIAQANAQQIANGATSFSKENVNIAIALSLGELNSTTTVGDATIRSGGAIDISSVADKFVFVSSVAAAGREGSLGLGVGVSDIDSTVRTDVLGTLEAQSNVKISADLNSSENTTYATASVGESGTLAKGKQIAAKGVGKVGDKIASSFNKSTQFADKLTKKLGSSKADTAGKTGLSGGLALVLQTNTVTSQIGQNASVTSQSGGVSILSGTADGFRSRSISRLSSSESAKNTRDNALSVATIYGRLTNSAEAIIDQNASVTAHTDVLVQSEARVPWEQIWTRWTGLTDADQLMSLIGKLNANLGIQDGFFNSWAQASANSEKRTLGGSVTVVRIDSTSNALIKEGAQITTGGQTSVIALNENDTLNNAGQFLTALPIPGGFGASGASSKGSGVGGSMTAVTYLNTTNAKILTDAIVDTGSLLVMARSDERNVSLSLQGGSSKGNFAFNGAGNLLRVDNYTLAQVDDGARITVDANSVVNIPRDYDVVDLSDPMFFSNVPQFFPFEPIDPDSNLSVSRVDPSNNTIALPYDHGLVTGQPVYYLNGGGVSIGGLTNETAYQAIVIDENTLQLAEMGDSTLAPIDLNLDETEGLTHSLLPGFNPQNDVANNTISGLPEYLDLLLLPENNRPEEGDDLPVRYIVAEGATPFPNLTIGKAYLYRAISPGVGQLLDLDTQEVITLDPSVASGEHFLIPAVVDLDGATSEIVDFRLQRRNPLLSLDTTRDGIVSASDDRVAAVTDDVYITDVSVAVIADDFAGLYSGTGGFTRGRAVGAGVSVVISEIDRETNAIIGNVDRSIVDNLTRDFQTGLGVGVDHTDTIYLGYRHGFTELDQVTYSAGGDIPIGGLRDGDSYFVNIVGDSDNSGDPTIKLARSVEEALESVTTLLSVANFDSAPGLDTIDLGYVHGFQLGDWVTYDAGSGTAIGGLEDGQTYYVIPVSATEIALAATQNIATEHLNLIFDPKATVSEDTLVFAGEHGLSTGQRLFYSDGGGAAIGGLTNGQVVVAEVIDEYAIRLKTLARAAIALDAESSVGLMHGFQTGIIGTSSNVFDRNEIDLGFTHELGLGDTVLYSAIRNGQAATPITGLTPGGVYHVVSTGETTMRLAATEELADKARWWFFDSAVDVIDDDTVNFAFPHPYELNDELTYTTSEYYADPLSQTIAPLQYIDPNTNMVQSLAEGQTVYAIPTDTELLLDIDSGQLLPFSTGLKIALQPDGPALQLINSDSLGFHGFRSDAAAIQITAIVETETTHLFQPYRRIDIDSSTGTGNDHTIRLALDPTTTTQATHGIGKTFVPSNAIANSNTTINFGFDHGFETGDAVVYSNGRGQDIGNLGHINIYYVFKLDNQSFSLAESAQEVLSANPEVLVLDPSQASGSLHGFGKVFEANPYVDSTLDAINFGRQHGLLDGETVVYHANGGSAIGGLADGNTYRVVLVGDEGSTIQLIDPQTNLVVDLDGTLATGDQHSFDEQVSATGFITSAGNGLIASNNAGDIVSISIAGAKTTSNQSKPANSSQTNNASANASTQPKEIDLNSASSSSMNVSPSTSPSTTSNTGIAIAGSFAINVVVDTTQALINDATLTLADLSLQAANQTEIGTGSGAVAITLSSDSGRGLAGAVVVNVVSNTTKAMMTNATVTITGGDLEVTSANTVSIVSVAMGLAGTSGSFALAGSVSVNVISSEAFAVIGGDSQVLVSATPNLIDSGDVNISSLNDNTILSIAGSVAGNVKLPAIKKTKKRDGSPSTTTERKNGVGAALSFNRIATPKGSDADPRGTVAMIVDSDISADGFINVAADTTNTITSVAAAIAFTFGGGSRSAATALSFSINTTRIPTNAIIRREGSNTGLVAGDKGVRVDADDRTKIVSVAGNVALAKNSANGVAVSVNATRNQVTSQIDSATVTSSAGDIQVLATSEPTLTSIAAGGAVSSQTARQGSFSVTVVNNATNAQIVGSGSNVSAEGSVLVSASDISKIFTLGGSVVISGLDGSSSSSPMSSFGIANSTLVTGNAVRAFISGTSIIQADGNLAPLNDQTDVGVLVLAHSDDTLTTIAAAGVLSAAESGISIAGSATVTILNETNRAYIGAGVSINGAETGESSNQDVIIRAIETTQLVGIAGAASISLKASGIGAGVDVSFITKDVQAWIGEGADVYAEGDVVVQASSEEDITSVNGSVAIAGNGWSAAGGVGVSDYDITTKALIKSTTANPTSVTAGDSVLVATEERTEFFQINLNFSASLSSGAAVGGAFGIPIVTKTTESKIGDGAVVNAYANGDGLTVNTGDFQTFGGDTSTSGIAGSLNLDNTNLPLNDKSYFQNSNATPNQKTGFKGVAVTAVNSDQIEMYNVGMGVSGGSFAVQISVGVNTMNLTTNAEIGANAQINQTATQANGAHSEQSVHVAAGSDFFTRSIQGGVAGSFGAGAATPGVGVTYVTMDTTATIGGSAQVNARKNVSVFAHNSEDLEVVAIALAGAGGSFAGAGAFSVIDINNTTTASIADGATVQADGNVTVFAEDLTDTDLISGGVGVAIGGGGIGVSIGLGLIRKDTQAFIGEAATVEALGLGVNNTFDIRTLGYTGDEFITESLRGIGVHAYSVEDMFALGVAGGFGPAVGIAGSVTWQQINSDTTAYIDRNAQINTSPNNASIAHVDQSVAVTAINQVLGTGIDGAVSGGAFGFGGSFDIGTIANETEAAILADLDQDSVAQTDTGVVNARNDVRVEAGSDRTITSVVASLGGGIFSLQIGLSLWTVGGTASATYDVDGQTEDPAADLTSSTLDVADDSIDLDHGYESSGSGGRGDNSAIVAGLVGDGVDSLQGFGGKLIFGKSMISSTKASIGANATINAGDDVLVKAHEETQHTAFGGALSGGALGAGAGIALGNIGSKASAVVGAGAIVAAGDTVEVSASADETTDMYGVAGSGGIVAVAGQYAESNVQSVQSASIGANAQIVSANTVIVSANQTRDLHAFTAGGGIGGVTAGFSGAEVVAGGTVEAVVDQGVSLGTAQNPLGSVRIAANSRTTQARAEAYSISAGLGLAASSAAVEAEVAPTVQAATLDSVAIHTNGDVWVQANAEARVIAKVLGVQLAGGAAGGFSETTAVVSPKITAALGSNNTIVTGGDVRLRAVQSLVNNNYSADANGYGVAGSLFISVAGVQANAVSKTSTNASVGAGTSITASAGTVSLRSDISNKLKAKTDGGNGAGIVAAGTNHSVLQADTSAVALVGSGANITAQTLEIVATGSESIQGEAENNKFSFGFTTDTSIAANTEYSTQVTIQSDSTTTAAILKNNSNNQSISVDTLRIIADHETTLDGKSEDIAVGLIAGLGGAKYSADLNSNVNARLGDGVVVDARTIAMNSGNTAGMIPVTPNVFGMLFATSVTGGAGAKSEVINEVDVNFNTVTDIGKNARVNADYVLTGDPSAISGGVDLVATNDAQLFSNTDMGSFSLFGGSINSNAILNLSNFDAIVAVGDNTILKSSGEITLATRSSADLLTKAEAIGRSRKNNSQAEGTSRVNTSNQIGIGTGVLVESEDDINFLAGQIGVLETINDSPPDLNIFTLEAITDIYAYNVVPNKGTDVTATAQVIQNNNVNVASNARLRAVSDAYLLTESGAVLTQASSTFDSIYGTKPSDEVQGNSDNNLIVVEGDIEVGLFNRKTLELDSNGAVTSGSDQNILVTVEPNFSLDASLEQRINTLLAETAWFQGSTLDAVYEEQRAFWSNLVEELGGTLNFNGQQVDVTGVSLPTARIAPIFATSGNIYLEAENFRGSGRLTAPTDTAIEILNHSPMTLFVDGLTIPDRPGEQVRFNRVQVSSISEIQALNTNSALDSLVNLNFDFSYDPNSQADASTEPLLSVTNIPDPTQDISSNLLFEGDVTNRSGDVTIDGGAGSVLVNGNLTAGSLSIASGGDFVFGDTDSNGDGFFHTGGDPFDLYSAVAEANEAANSLVSDPQAPVSGTAGSVSDDAGSTIVAGNVLITSENINVNLIIQSGISYHEVTISDPGDLQATVDAATVAYESADPASADSLRYVNLDAKYLNSATGNASNDLFDSIQDNLGLQWDARDQTLILVGEIEVKGGFMQLTANRILNTSGGALRVLDGYGTIDIENQTALPITLSNLSVGRGSDDTQGIEGTITLTEKARANEAAAGQGALITRITRANGEVTVVTNATVDAQGNPTHVTTTSGNTVNYAPLGGTRYNWVSSGAEASTRIYEVNNQSSRITNYFDIVQPQNLVSETDNGRSELTSSGSYVSLEPGQANDVYQYRFTFEDNLDDFYWLTTIREIYGVFGKLRRTEYDARITESIKTLTTHTNSVKADYPISVTFVGEETGGIRVDSLGSVIIGGPVAARGGQVTINAGVNTSDQVVNSAATIESVDQNGVLIAMDYSLNAPGGIGTSGPLYLDQTHGALKTASSVTASSGGDITLSSASDVLSLGFIQSTSPTGVIDITASSGEMVSALGPNTYLDANSIILSAASNIGKPSRRILLETGSSPTGTLMVNATQQVAVQELTGDLYVNLIESNLVDIDVPSGDLLDATSFETASRDADTIAELVATWNSLGLINEGAEARKTAIISDNIAIRDFEYGIYWDIRSSMANPSNPTSYSFQFSPEQVTRMLELGFTETQIAGLEASSTAVLGPQCRLRTRWHLCHGQ